MTQMTPREILIELMKEKGIREFDIINKISMTNKNIHDILKGDERMTLENAEELGKFFKVEPSYFKVKEHTYREFSKKR